MIEVLISVLVLGLVVVASLKLTALSEKSLAAVREKEELIDMAESMKIALAIDPLQFFGSSGDIRWTVDEREEDLFFDERLYGLVDPDDEQTKMQIERIRDQKIRWRELRMNYKDQDIFVFLPYSREAAEALSEDRIGTKE